MATRFTFLTQKLNAGHGFAALLCLTACAAEVSPAQPADDANIASIERLIAGAACTADTDCRTIGIGAKSCGGPAAYLAWSARQTDARALETAVTRYNKVQLKRQEALGLASNCAFVPDPGAVCVAAPAGGRCELARGRAATAR